MDGKSQQLVVASSRNHRYGFDKKPVLPLKAACEEELCKLDSVESVELSEDEEMKRRAAVVFQVDSNKSLIDIV